MLRASHYMRTGGSTRVAPIQEKILQEKILQEKILQEKILQEKILQEKILQADLAINCLGPSTAASAHSNSF